jgi:hypothetical protein
MIQLSNVDFFLFSKFKLYFFTCRLGKYFSRLRLITTVALKLHLLKLTSDFQIFKLKLKGSNSVNKTTRLPWPMYDAYKGKNSQ